MSSTCSPAVDARRPSRAATPVRARSGLLDMLFALAALRRQRRRLGDLDPALLRDIGLTEAEAADEARRPLWDAPRWWLG